MKKVLLITDEELDTMIVSRVEKALSQRMVQERKDEVVYKVSEAAGYLRMTEEGVRNARRKGRLKGFLINEKEWGFYHSELERYKRRYKRYQEQ